MGKVTPALVEVVGKKWTMVAFVGGVWRLVGGLDGLSSRTLRGSNQPLFMKIGEVVDKASTLQFKSTFQFNIVLGNFLR